MAKVLASIGICGYSISWALRSRCQTVQRTTWYDKVKLGLSSIRSRRPGMRGSSTSSAPINQLSPVRPQA